MPKRSNEFQKLIFLVKQQVSENAVVTESKMLTDLITGTEREVDICIETTVAGHEVLVCIECTNTCRVADVTWVERLKSKHERLPTNVLVLVSNSGFTPEALKVAQSYHIQTLALEDVNKKSVSRILGEIDSLWAKTWDLVPKKVVIKVPAFQNLVAEDIVTSPDNALYLADGTEVGDVKQLIDFLLKDENLVVEIGRQGEETHKSFVFWCDLPRDQAGQSLYMQKLEPKVLRPIGSIHVEGSCKIKVSEFPLKRGSLGDYQIAWGSGVFRKEKALLVASEDNKGNQKLTISTATLQLGPKLAIKP